MIVFFNDKKFTEFKYSLEEHFESMIIKNSKLFFGEKTIIIDAKKKIDTKSLGGSIPDAFLFDFNDLENPLFYLIEVELAKHDFFRHIFPQITKFFAFFKNKVSQKELIDKIYSIVNTDDIIKNEFKKYLGEKEIYKSISDIIDESQNILLIIDGDKNELPEIMETYNDTWGKAVRTIKISSFTNNSEIIHSMEPDFENIEISYDESDNDATNTNDAIDKNFWLKKSEIVSRVAELLFDYTKDIYKEAKLIYNNGGITISCNSYNQMRIKKRMGEQALIIFRCGNNENEISELLSSQNISFYKNSNKIRFKMNIKEIETHKDMFRKIAELNYKWWQNI